MGYGEDHRLLPALLEHHRVVGLGHHNVCRHVHHIHRGVDTTIVSSVKQRPPPPSRATFPLCLMVGWHRIFLTQYYIPPPFPLLSGHVIAPISTTFAWVNTCTPTYLQHALWPNPKACIVNDKATLCSLCMMKSTLSLTSPAYRKSHLASNWRAQYHICSGCKANQCGADISSSSGEGDGRGKCKQPSQTSGRKRADVSRSHHRGGKVCHFQGGLSFFGALIAPNLSTTLLNFLKNHYIRCVPLTHGFMNAGKEGVGSFMSRIRSGSPPARLRKSWCPVSNIRNREIQPSPPHASDDLHLYQQQQYARACCRGKYIPNPFRSTRHS